MRTNGFTSFIAGDLPSMGAINDYECGSTSTGVFQAGLLPQKMVDDPICRTHEHQVGELYHSYRKEMWLRMAYPWPYQHP